MKTLHLTLKKKWFDMILSGEKKEEYREQKGYWFKRLTNFFEGNPLDWSYKEFGTVTFKNGYSVDAPEMVVKLIRITEGKGLPEWGGD